MVYNLPRSASVRAATPCVIFRLDRADLKKVLQHYPKGGPLWHFIMLPSFNSLDMITSDRVLTKSLSGGGAVSKTFSCT